MEAITLERIIGEAQKEKLIEFKEEGKAKYYRIKPSNEGYQEWREVGIRTGSAG